MTKTQWMGAAWLLAALLATPALAQPAPIKLLPARSEVSFTSKQMGVPVDGHFRKFDAQIQLDPRKPETGSIVVVVDTGSATLGSAEPDAEMPKAPWFNVARFPQATFKSSAVKAAGGGKFEVAGSLQVKGKARDIVVPVQIVQSGGESTASGSFVIKRLDFGIGEGEWAEDQERHGREEHDPPGGGRGAGQGGREPRDGPDEDGVPHLGDELPRPQEDRVSTEPVDGSPSCARAWAHVTTATAGSGASEIGPSRGAGGGVRPGPSGPGNPAPRETSLGPRRGRGCDSFPSPAPPRSATPC